MATAIVREPATLDNLADLHDRIGNVRLERIRVHPAPGTATEEDVGADGMLRLWPGRVCIPDVCFISWDRLNLGIVLGADGMLRLWPGRIRIPDVSFISWSKLPEGRLPDVPVASLAPDLAVEVLSSSNTAEEIKRKLEDLFRCGMRLAWVIDPIAETAEIYHTPTACQSGGGDSTLDGEDVLPGFGLSLRKLFARTRQSRE